MIRVLFFALAIFTSVYAGGPPEGHVFAKQLSSCHTLYNRQTIRLPVYPIEGWENDNGVVHFPETFVLEMARGRVFGKEGVVVTSDNKVLADLAIEWDTNVQRSDWKPLSEHSIFKRHSMPQVRHVSGRVAVLATYFSRCYYHWLFELLPRIKLLRDSGVLFDKVYIPKIAYPAQRITLEMLGVTPDLWIEADDDTYIEADTLIVPSLPHERFCTHPNWVIGFLRDSFLKDVRDIKPRRRLFITRKMMTSQSARKIINEGEVYEYLRTLGFERVALEDLSFDEQVKLFASAETIVAAHGAALSNLVFCRPGTTIIEISNPLHVNATYWYLGQQMGLDHHCLETPLEGLTDEQKACSDIYVPLGMLRNVVERVSRRF